MKEYGWLNVYLLSHESNKFIKSQLRDKHRLGHVRMISRWLLNNETFLLKEYTIVFHCTMYDVHMDLEFIILTIGHKILSYNSYT